MLFILVNYKSCSLHILVNYNSCSLYWWIINLALYIGEYRFEYLLYCASCKCSQIPRGRINTYFVISFSSSCLFSGLFLIGFSTGFSSPLTSIYVTEACISIIVPQKRQMSLLSPDLIILNWLSYKLSSRWRVPAIKGLSHQSSTVSSLLDFSSSIWFT